MKATTWVFLLGAAALASGGGMTACGSSGNGNGPSSSGSGGGADSGPDTSGSSSGGSSSGSGSSSGCKSDPTLHAGTPGDIFCGYTDAGSFSCSTGQQCCLGGKLGTGFAPEACETFGGTCTNGSGPLPIECQQPEDCAANAKTGAVCCLQGGASLPAPVSGCDAKDLKSQGGSGIVCEMPHANPVAGSDAGTSDAGEPDGGASDAGSSDAGSSADAAPQADSGTGGGVGSCAAGELQVCEAQSDCPTGKTCTPTRWKLYEIGVCL